MYNKHGGYNGAESVVDYSININPHGVSTVLKDKLWRTLDELERYPQIDGQSTREKLSRSLGIAGERLIIGNGATELIYLFSRALGIERAIVVEPTFTEYSKSVEIIGGTVEDYSLDTVDFSLDVKGLLQKAESEKSEAIYLCSPNNPTGNTVDRDDIEVILENCKETGKYLFLDESFIEFSERDSCIELTESHNLFVLRSITKIYGVPGIRIGYGVGNRDIVEKMNEAKEPWSVNSMALQTMETYLDDDEYRLETKTWYEAEKSKFVEKLRSLDYMDVFDSDANFVLCRLKSKSAKELQSYLLKVGFYIRTCEDFHGLDETYIRLAVRRGAENDRLIDELKLYRGADILG